MKNKIQAHILLILAGLCTAFLMLLPGNAAAFDEFDNAHAPSRFKLDYHDFTLELKGRARLGLHDLQGEGGPEYDSPTDTATIGTRSPFVELDSFDLSFRINWKEMIWLNTNISFYTDSTSLSAIYFEYKDDLEFWFSHGVEVGYQSPVVATDRRTVRYPLIALNYWRNPEYHAAYAAKFSFNEDISLSLYGSVGIMRPLKLDPIHGSPTYAGAYSTLAYGSAKPYSGNSASGTLMLRLEAAGFQADLFGHLGQITSKKGLDTIISGYTYYRMLDDFDSSQLNVLAWWAGGRIAYNGYGVHFLAEAIASQEQLIRRVGTYAQISYAYTRDTDFLNMFEFLVRYDALWTLDSTHVNQNNLTLRTPEINNAISWDHHLITLGARLNIVEDILSVRLEYTFFLEKNGIPALKIDDKVIDDNELLLQIEARY